MDSTRDVLEGTYKIEEYLVSAKREEKKQVIIADLWAKKKKKDIGKHEGSPLCLA